MRAALISVSILSSPSGRGGGLVAVVALAALVDGVLGVVEAKSSSGSSKEVLALQEPGGFEETYTAASFASSVVRFGDLSRAEEILSGLLASVAVEGS